MGWIRLEPPKGEPEPQWMRDCNAEWERLGCLLKNDIKPTLEEQDHYDSIVEQRPGKIVVRA